VENDLDKLIIGFVIGGLLSGSALYLVRANKKQKQLFFKRIGKIIPKIGNFLKKIDLEEKNAAFEEMMKIVPKKGKLADFMMLAAIGITLWEKWR
jgi:hypothetical protein